MTQSPKTEYDALVIGGGLAGLNAAITLQAAGKRFLLLESSDRLGGRLRTDPHQGFLLDHGFQVLLTAYSECQSALDYPALQLGRFQPGSYLWTGKKLETIADPLRQPSLLFPTLLSSAGSLADKLRIARLKRSLSPKTDHAIFRSPEQSTHDYLRQKGFSKEMIERFLKPFFSGIFLEDQLASSSRMFEFVFKCFGHGHAALPAQGMQAIPQQLAKRLPPDSIRLNTKVTSLTPSQVTTETGETLHARSILLAADMAEAARLSPAVTDRGWNGTRCHYFAADRSPLARPMIALNASGHGLIQNLCVPSDVSPSYAPHEQALLCVSTSSYSDPTPDQLKEELATWFGTPARNYQYLRSYHVPNSLPLQRPGDLPFDTAQPQLENGIWIAGDHRHSSSIQGALASGRQTAQALLQSL